MAVPDRWSVRRRRRGVAASAAAAGVGLLAAPVLVSALPSAAPLAVSTIGVEASAGNAAACVSYWLQIGAFRDGANASRLVASASTVLPADGGPALLVAQVDVGGAPLYRVLSGPHDAAAAEARRAAFLAAGMPVSASTSTVACPAVTTTAPPVISAEAPSLTAGIQVQVGAFRSLDYAQRRADEVNAALGGAVVAGEFSVVTVEHLGAPLHRVRSRAHARAEADALLVLVRTTVPEAALVTV